MFHSFFIFYVLDTPAFHSFKPQYPQHLYPYQAVFFVSTIGTPQQTPAGTFAYQQRPDFPDVGFSQLDQPGPNVYTIDFVETPERPQAPLRPETPYLAHVPLTHDAGVPIVQPEIIKQTVEYHHMPNVEQEADPEVPQLDLNPYKLPLRPDEQPEEVPVVVKNVDIPPPSTDLNDDVRKIPIYVSSEEDSVEVSSGGMPVEEEADEKKSVPVPSTDLFDDVNKIPVASANMNEDTPSVTEKSEAAVSSVTEGTVDSIEATTEAATLVGNAEEEVEEERTEIPETSTASSS